MVKHVSFGSGMRVIHHGRLTTSLQYTQFLFRTLTTGLQADHCVSTFWTKDGMVPVKYKIWSAHWHSIQRHHEEKFSQLQLMMLPNKFKFSRWYLNAYLCIEEIRLFANPNVFNIGRNEYARASILVNSLCFTWNSWRRVFVEKALIDMDIKFRSNPCEYFKGSKALPSMISCYYIRDRAFRDFLILQRNIPEDGLLSHF